MSYGIIRIQKFTRSGAKGIEIHDQRERKVSHSNKDIDFNKSESNYDLINSEKINYLSKIDEKINKLELKKAVRKDAIVMCQCLVTSDNEYFKRISKEKQEEYFKKSLEFIEKKYGKENIVSATVHLDEKTPHMHINFVPITQDKRLSAKDLFKRNDLVKLHDQFYKEVGKDFGLERGKNSETFVKHLETEDLKIQTKLNEFDKSNKELLGKESLQKSSERFDNIKYDQELTLFKKPTGRYLLTEEQELELKKYAKQGITYRDKFIKAEKQIKEQNEKIEMLEKKIIEYPTLDNKIKNLESDLENSNKKSYSVFNNTMSTYITQNSNDKNLDENFTKYFEKSLKNILYPMKKAEKEVFCKGISWEVLGRNMEKSVKNVYGISTGQIKENNRGNGR